MGAVTIDTDKHVVNWATWVTIENGDEDDKKVINQIRKSYENLGGKLEK